MYRIAEKYIQNNLPQLYNRKSFYTSRYSLQLNCKAISDKCRDMLSKEWGRRKIVTIAHGLLPTFFIPFLSFEKMTKESVTCSQCDWCRRYALAELSWLSPFAANITDCCSQGPDMHRTRFGKAIFRFSLTDNFDPSLNFPNI